MLSRSLQDVKLYETWHVAFDLDWPVNIYIYIFISRDNDMFIIVTGYKYRSQIYNQNFKYIGGVTGGGRFGSPAAPLYSCWDLQWDSCKSRWVDWGIVWEWTKDVRIAGSLRWRRFLRSMCSQFCMSMYVPPYSGILAKPLLKNKIREIWF